jgi:DNA polymerase
VYSVVLNAEKAASDWRDAARRLAAADVPPEAVQWSTGRALAIAPALPQPPDGGGFTLPRSLVALTGTALGADDPERFGLLYRLVWRARSGERVMEDPADPDVLAAQVLARGAERQRLLADPAPMVAARAAASACRACALWAGPTQTVFGEGPADAPIMLVGEQPGDQEDIEGRPFVGPAGRLLDQALAAAGLDRAGLYVTNAVKHFKFTRTTKRRLHQSPDAGEIAICRFWLDLEREVVRPRLTVMLGASAARAVLGRPVTIGRERGHRLALPDGAAGFVTVHPSFLLRLPDEAAKAREYEAFVRDLRAVRTLA